MNKELGKTANRDLLNVIMKYKDKLTHYELLTVSVILVSGLIDMLYVQYGYSRRQSLEFAVQLLEDLHNNNMNDYLNKQRKGLE